MKEMAVQCFCTYSPVENKCYLDTFTSTSINILLKFLCSATTGISKVNKRWEKAGKARAQIQKTYFSVHLRYSCLFKTKKKPP